MTKKVEDIIDEEKEKEKEVNKMPEVTKKFMKVEFTFGQSFRFGLGFGAGLLFLLFILVALVVGLDFLLLEELIF